MAFRKTPTHSLVAKNTWIILAYTTGFVICGTRDGVVKSKSRETAPDWEEYDLAAESRGAVGDEANCDTELNKSRQ